MCTIWEFECLKPYSRNPYIFNTLYSLYRNQNKIFYWEATIIVFYIVFIKTITWENNWYNNKDTNWDNNRDNNCIFYLSLFRQ